MGELIEFPSNGDAGSGYLAEPSGGASGTPGILVLQEWWGLVDQIKRTCDRLADEGFTALAPDLYHGATVPLTEPDDAAKLMMALEMERVATDLSGSVDELIRRTGRHQIGVIGFCMGGGLALVLATQRPDAVKAVVPAYGVIPWPAARPTTRSWTRRCRRTSRNKTTSSPRKPPVSSRPSCRVWGRPSSFTSTRARDMRSSTRTDPRPTTSQSAGQLWERTDRVLPADTGVIRRNFEPVPVGRSDVRG